MEGGQAPPGDGAPSGDRLHAVLIEPQLARFRALCGLDGVPLTASFEGWHRHAILAPDRVFLFPRHRAGVPGLRREGAVLSAIAGRGVPAPRLLGRWQDPGVSPYPFIAVSRLPGRTWSQLEAGATLEQVLALMEGLGRAIATWHRLPARSLPRTIPRRRDGVGRFLATERHEAAHDVASHLGLPPGRAAVWQRTLEPLAALPPVLVHGDVNEGQILVDGDLRVTGILDWETAHVGHPAKDFDLGEWGYGVFAWSDRFDRLHRRLWEAYAGARCAGQDAPAGPAPALPDWRALHLLFLLRWTAEALRRTEPTPWQRDHLEVTVTLLRRLDGDLPG